MNMLHPPAVVHVSPTQTYNLLRDNHANSNSNSNCNNSNNSNSNNNGNCNDDDCSDLSSAAGRTGSRNDAKTGDDDEYDDDLTIDDDNDSIRHYDDDDDDDDDIDSPQLTQRIAAVQLEQMKQRQQQHSAFLGRQSRKSRLLRRNSNTALAAAAQQHHGIVPTNDHRHHHHHHHNNNDHVQTDNNNNMDQMNGCKGATHPSPPYHHHHHLHDRPPQIEEKKCDASQESQPQQQQPPPPPPPFAMPRSLLWKNETTPQLPETRDPSIRVQNEDEEGAELPLRRILPLPTSSSKLSPASLSSSLSLSRTNVPRDTNNNNTKPELLYSPIDEVDELDYHHPQPPEQQPQRAPSLGIPTIPPPPPPPTDTFPSSSSSSSSSSRRHVLRLDDEPPPPPPFDEVMAPFHTNNNQHQPRLLWKESESFDDDIDLYMAPTDEADVHNNNNNNNNNNSNDDDDDDSTDFQTMRPEFISDSNNVNDDCARCHDDPITDNVPLDESLLDQTFRNKIVDNHNNNKNSSSSKSKISIDVDNYDGDLPPIAPVPKYFDDRPFASTGTTADTPIVVEDWTTTSTNTKTDDANFDLFQETNVLNISIDSNDSSAGPIGPLIRWEQHQPLLLNTMDDISSSDETPLAGNGPLASRIHRSRAYREPRLSGYWKEQQQQQQRQQQQKRSKLSHRKRALRNRKIKTHHSPLSTSPEYQPNENSIDHVLPPLIIDPEQLRSVGINAILAVCNGIGSLFLISQEASSSLSSSLSCRDSPRDSKPTDRYKLLADDDNVIKKRSTKGAKSRKIKLEPEEMSPSDQTGNTSTSDVTPVYFEDALQRSIEAEIKAGDERLTKANMSIQPRYDVVDQEQFANLDQSNVHVRDQAYQLKRTISAPIPCTVPRSRESTDRLWLDMIRAVKCSSQPPGKPPDGSTKSVPVISESSSSSSPLLKSDTPIERFTPTPYDESFPLENKLGKRHIGIRRLMPAAAKRIAARRDSKIKANNDSKVDNGIGGPANSHSLYSPAISSMVGRDGGLSPISPVTERQSKSNESPIIHTPLAEPPALRRLNKSLDFDESFGPDFVTSVTELEEPPSLSRPTVIDETKLSSLEPEGDIPAISIRSGNVESKPSADRSPMSDFLLLRLQTGGSDMISTKAVERSASPYDDSDCSSTGELLSSLDGLVKDLDGMASSRRTERQLTTDSPISDAQLLPELLALTGASIVDHVAALKVIDTTIVAGMPELIDPLNSDIGIPGGDIMISLLKSDKVEPTWVSRVDESIWRGRTMRRQFDTLSAHRQQYESCGIPLRRRTSFCVDLDDGRVVVGIDEILEIQETANELLQQDEFDDALALQDAICSTYRRRMDDMDQSDERMVQMKSYVAAAQYNLGIVHMLRGEHDDAIEYFEQSTILYSTSRGVGHAMHISSLVKTAICHFAMEDYTTAYSELELALSLSRDNIHTLSDHRQIAEVLNNLGSLSYMGGEIERSMLLFRESIKVLTRAVDFAMYSSESKFDNHSTMLALTIAKSNVAFLSLTFYRDVSESVSMFESVMKEQQLLLRDADVTLLSTMEHLAAANLLAGDKSKALQLLRRVLQMQMEVYGSDHGDNNDGNDDDDDNDHGEPRSVCERTRHKIAVLEQSDNNEASDAHDQGDETTKDSHSILPILETSCESSSGGGSHTTGSPDNDNNGDDNDPDGPNTSMTNTLKAWRQSHAMTDESFLTHRVIM